MLVKAVLEWKGPAGFDEWSTSRSSTARLGNEVVRRPIHGDGRGAGRVRRVSSRT